MTSLRAKINTSKAAGDGLWTDGALWLVGGAAAPRPAAADCLPFSRTTAATHADERKTDRRRSRPRYGPDAASTWYRGGRDVHAARQQSVARAPSNIVVVVVVVVADEWTRSRRAGTFGRCSLGVADRLAAGARRVRPPILAAALSRRRRHFAHHVEQLTMTCTSTARFPDLLLPYTNRERQAIDIL